MPPSSTADNYNAISLRLVYKAPPLARRPPYPQKLRRRPTGLRLRNLGWPAPSGSKGKTAGLSCLAVDATPAQTARFASDPRAFLGARPLLPSCFSPDTAPLRTCGGPGVWPGYFRPAYDWLLFSGRGIRPAGQTPRAGPVAAIWPPSVERFKEMETASGYSLSHELSGDPLRMSLWVDERADPSS